MCDSCAPRSDTAPATDPAPATDSTQPNPHQQAEALHRHIGQLVLVQRRATRELAISLARMQAKQLHRELGYARLGEYGEQAFGFSPTKTRQLAQLGRALPELPALDHAMRAGVLGWTKARTLLPVITPDTEQAWVARALEINNRELEDQASRAVRGDDPPDPETEFEPPRYVWTRVRLDAYHFERVMQAVGEIRHHLDDADVSMSQCMLWMAERCLDGALFETEPAEEAETDDATHVCQGENAFAHNYRIIEHRCPACDKAWTEGRAGRMEMDPDERAMVECDAEIVAGDDSAGTPGHVSRTIPPATRKAVLIRDGGRCQAPGCKCKHHLELHHVLARVDGGSNEGWNLVTLCSTHHDLVHKGVLGVTHGPDGQLVWERAGGQPLGVLVSIWGECRELTQDDLDSFEGPPGSWSCIQGYWGTLNPPPGFDTAHVCSAGDPRDRYPRGRQLARIGDEVQMAPSWMARNLGLG